MCVCVGIKQKVTLHFAVSVLPKTTTTDDNSNNTIFPVPACRILATCKRAYESKQNSRQAWPPWGATSLSSFFQKSLGGGNLELTEIGQKGGFWRPGARRKNEKEIFWLVCYLGFLALGAQVGGGKGEGNLLARLEYSVRPPGGQSWGRGREGIFKCATGCLQRPLHFSGGVAGRPQG